MTQEVTKSGKADRRTAIGARLQQACWLMVHEGLPFDEAAVKSNLTVRAMRLALKRPAVIRFLKTERDVFLASVSAANPRRLAELRDQDENKTAAVAAARAIEGLSDGEPERRMSVQTRPGLVIVVQNGPTRQVIAPPTIDMTPIPSDPQSEDESE